MGLITALIYAVIWMIIAVVVIEILLVVLGLFISVPGRIVKLCRILEGLVCLLILLGVFLPALPGPPVVWHR